MESEYPKTEPHVVESPYQFCAWNTRLDIELKHRVIEVSSPYSPKIYLAVSLVVRAEGFSNII